VRQTDLSSVGRPASHVRRSDTALARPNTTGQRPGRALRLLRDTVIICVIAVLVSAGLKTFVVRSFTVPSGSMENTLQVSDMIVVNELVPRVIPLERGDVVVFADPGGWENESAGAGKPVSPVGRALTFLGLSADGTSDYFVKRLIGLPGDSVVCCSTSGRLTVNGTDIGEPYILGAPSNTEFSVTVPAGSLWVMGDNRADSWDSRYHPDTPGTGFVRVSDIVGRAVVISLPITRWAWLDSFGAIFPR
jgi:signal peptidase I